MKEWLSRWGFLTMFIAGAVLINIAAMLYGRHASAQSPFDCDPIYEDAERADTPAERQALAQLYIACMVRENWR